MITWLPIITPLAAAVIFAFLSLWMEKIQNQNKEKISSGNQPRLAGQKKPV